MACTKSCPNTAIIDVSLWAQWPPLPCIIMSWDHFYHLSSFSSLHLASVHPLHTLISIWTFVSCVRGLLTPASLKMRAIPTLRGVAGYRCVFQFKNSCLWIDIPRLKDEWLIYPCLLKFWSNMSFIRYPNAWNYVRRKSTISKGGE